MNEWTNEWMNKWIPDIAAQSVYALTRAMLAMDDKGVCEFGRDGKEQVLARFAGAVKAVLSVSRVTQNVA